MQESNRDNFQDRLRQMATLAAITIAFAVNIVSNIFPPNGITIGEVSNTLFRNVLLIPANYAFAIWGLIYLLLFVFGVYQVLPSQQQQPDLRKIGYLIVIASLAQSIWVYLFLWRQFALSLVAMLFILLPLIAAYLKIEIGVNSVSRIQKWCIHIPISIYLGWISVATIVNVACALYSQGWNGWGISAQIWTAILLLVAAVIAAVVIVQRQDIGYPGVTVWALIAIAVKNWDSFLLRTLALALAFILTLIMLFKLKNS